MAWFKSAMVTFAGGAESFVMDGLLVLAVAGAANAVALEEVKGGTSLAH